MSEGRRLPVPSGQLPASRRSAAASAAGAGAASAAADEPGEVVLDRLCRGWSIYQLARGYRFNGDDILLAHTANRVAPAARCILDLGSGIGSIGLLWLAQRPPGSSAVLLEAQERSVELCRRTLRDCGLLAGDGVSGGRRAEVRHGDLRDAAVREALGGGFDVVTANPPYLELADKKLPRHPQKRYCNYELRGGAQEFAEAAADQLAPGGSFCMVHAHSREADVLAAVAAAGFEVRERITAVARGAPKWVVVVCRRAGEEQAPAPPVQKEIVIREPSGQWTEAWNDICRELDVFQKQPAPETAAASVT